MPEIGKLLIIVGGFIVVVGLVLFLGVRIPFLGRLPGDISVDRGADSSSVAPIHCLAPMLQAPYPISETWRPVRPRAADDFW